MSQDWKVSTPIDTFANPETGSQIDIVSMLHVGLPSYYAKLGGYIMGRQDDGFTVHYEGITESQQSPELASPLTRIKQKLDDIHSDQIAEGFALVEVSSAYTIQDSSLLFREKGSENHDMTEADYTHQTSLFRHIKDAVRARNLRHKLEKAANKGPEHLDKSVFKVIKASVDKTPKRNGRRRNQDEVSIHTRNEIALDGVDGALEADEAAKLVLVWGLGHLAGLHSGLIERGYQHTGRQEAVAAIDHHQLERSMQRLEVKLRRVQAKLDRKRERTTPATVLGSPNRPTLAQYRKSVLPIAKDTQKLLADIDRRRKDTIRKLEQDRKRREPRIEGSTLRPKDEKRNRRPLPRFTNR